MGEARERSALGVHAVAQGFAFIVIPLLLWLEVRPWMDRLPEGLVLVFFMLSFLPTTITSIVVFTQLSGGNTPVAIFNAIGGNIAGVFVCPWILRLMLGTSEIELRLDTLGILLTLGSTVLLPFAVGAVIGRYGIGPHRARWRGTISTINSFGVLLIVYFAFCQLFGSPDTLSEGAALWLPLTMLVPGHFILLALAHGVGRWGGFARADRIALLFVAPQKTLSLGLPLIAASLKARPELIGLASLPIIIYHPLQLFVAGVLKDVVSRKRKSATDEPKMNTE